MQNLQNNNQQDGFGQLPQQNHKKQIPSWIGFVIIAVMVVILFGGVFAYQYFFVKNQTLGNVASIQGIYKKEFASISITDLGQNKIKISGIAVWEGPDAVNGQVHSGDIDGVIVLNDNKGVYKNQDCEIELTFSENKLSAKDNNRCGGLNVSFTGDYIRESATSSNDQIAGWKTYTNSQYGFSIQYSPDFALASSLTPSQKTKVGSYMGACPTGSAYQSPNEVGLCYVGNQVSDGFEAAALDIIPSASTSLQDCQKTWQDDNGQSTQQTIINGAVFYKDNLGDAGLGHQQTIGSYRTYNSGACYTVSLKIDSNWGKSEKGLSVDFRNIMQTKLDAMLSTFKFTNQDAQIPVSNYTTDYKLLKQSQADNNPPTKYIDDGVINSGNYAGYHRVVVLQITGEMYTGITYNVFITKDYKSFYFDSDLNQSGDLSAFDQTKVVGKVSDIPFNHPATISLGNFILVRKNDYPASTFDDFTIGSNFKELSSNTTGLLFFADQGGNVVGGEANNYISGITHIKAVDQFGLIFGYDMVSREYYARQLKNNQLPLSDNSRWTNSFYSNKDFASGFPSYESYDTPLPGGCGGNPYSGYILKNISINNLIPVGKTLNGLQLYALADANHTLYKTQYKSKIINTYEGYDGAMADAIRSNNGAPEPAYAEYIAKNPIIIFKDPWDRFVAVGEYKYILEAGCGKPVIYLYPEKPTEVKVGLEKPTRFTVDIPTYKNGWDVMANPDGLLKDLQPQYTDCSKINTKVFGSEYASDACTNNSYPYLYWAGQVDNIYPQANAGWVVAKSNLESFISEKLAVISLNNKEISDMVDYWVPELLAKNSPYYRISFFQTADMNKFAPMSITPKPDTLIRVFLDWSPLADGNMSIQPEKLNSINREGFTVVEWGGLKQ